MTTNLNRNFQYTPQTVQRAKRALSCSSFCLKLFQDMRNQSVPIGQIAEQKGVELGYAKQAKSEPQTEDELVWLINVGLLRREVDGQGLTDSFRLTPLGRQIVDLWERSGNEIPTASTKERVFDWFTRWTKYPS